MINNIHYTSAEAVFSKSGYLTRSKNRHRISLAQDKLLTNESGDRTFYA